jgi:YesN/AraC family two-component response regulator
MSGIFISVLAKIKRVYLTSSENKKVDNQIDSIISYICNNYKEDLSNKALGAVFNYHPNYINRLMQLHTNMSLHQYVLSHRISIALRLIQTTNIPISEIVLESGFHDFSHFSKYFKKKIGRNPTDFRHTQDDLLV